MKFGNVAITRAKHGYFMFNTNDSFVGRSLREYGEWCEKELDLLGQVVRPGDVVVDVGAYIGTHSIFFAKKVMNRGWVYAIEPQRLVFNMLCGNIALNGILNVKAIYAAAGSATGIITVPLLDPNTEQNFGAVQISKYDVGDVVDQICIDDLSLDKCDLIKIDVEGMERLVVKGAEKTINRFRPIVFVENNRTEGSAELIEYLQKLKYKCWWQAAPYYNEKNYLGNKVNVFGKFGMEVNMFCLPKENPIQVEGLEPVMGSKDNWGEAIKRISRRQ